MREVWKPIAEYYGLYEVSNLGNVRRLEYTDQNGNEIARFYSMSEASRQTGIATSSINSSVKNNRPIKLYKWEVV